MAPKLPDNSASVTFDRITVHDSSGEAELLIDEPIEAGE